VRNNSALRTRFQPGESTCDENAAKSAKAVGAIAYAVGQQPSVRAGQYASFEREAAVAGPRLTHVVQQSARGVVASPVSIEDSPRAEYEADRIATQVASGEMAFRARAPRIGTATRGGAASASRNVDSMPLEEAVKNIPSLSQGDAIKVLKSGRLLSAYGLAAGREGSGS